MLSIFQARKAILSSCIFLKIIKKAHNNMGFFNYFKYFNYLPLRTSLEMTIFCTSLVPSYMRRMRASRYMRSMGKSFI